MWVDLQLPAGDLLPEGAGVLLDSQQLTLCRVGDSGEPVGHVRQWLWESPLRAEAFTQTYADSLGVLFRVYGYSALIPDR